MPRTYFNKTLMLVFKLKDHYIELVKLLKLMNVSESGGQAKKMIEDGCVFRNGEVELRKRAKIIAGDIIQVFEIIIEVS